jgi:hypothetical protein
MKRLTNILRQHPWLADLTALCGLLVNVLQLWWAAHNQLSVLDEGLYLYKGWLFASGQYTPFQDYGPWTNQMPLAFLIPGWIQLIFGLGLRTGRMASFGFGILTALGLWATSRRLGSRWIAAGMVWALALNPAAIRMVSMAASQGLIAFLLAWTMFFSLGDDRKPWQLLLGGLLAGAAVVVRINLLPLLPLLTLYILWARGWKPTLWLLMGEIAVFGGIHWLYWPNILRLWAKWLPFSFLQPWFPPPNTPVWNPDNPAGFRVASFFLAFRYHFTAMFGALVAWILWPAGITTERRKIFTFLSVLFLAFITLHAWAALGNEYCVFCFPTYTTFYSGIGLLLLAVAIPGWTLAAPAWRKGLGSLLLLALLGGMAYSAEGTAETLLGENFYKRLLSLQVPGMGGAQVWQIVANKFQLEYETLFELVHAWFPVAVAVGLGLVIFGAAVMLLGRKNSAALGAGFAFLLILGTLFSSSPLLGGEYAAYDCPQDVLPAYESAGRQISAVVPPGAKVFWNAYSPVTLLYLPQARVHPGQLHGVYSLRISDDSDALLRYGWMNQAVSEAWLNQADFVLVSGRNLGRNDRLQSALDADFSLVLETAPISCQPDSEILVFQRK